MLKLLVFVFHVIGALALVASTQRPRGQDSPGCSALVLLPAVVGLATGISVGVSVVRGTNPEDLAVGVAVGFGGTTALVGLLTLLLTGYTFEMGYLLTGLMGLSTIAALVWTASDVLKVVSSNMLFLAGVAAPLPVVFRLLMMRDQQSRARSRGLEEPTIV